MNKFKNCLQVRGILSAYAVGVTALLIGVGYFSLAEPATASFENPKLAKDCDYINIGRYAPSQICEIEVNGVTCMTAHDTRELGISCDWVSNNANPERGVGK